LAADTATAVSDRFPALKELEEDAEPAKLEQALAEARAGSTKAKLPSLDVEVAADTARSATRQPG